jgi:hypothetical protein
MKSTVAIVVPFISTDAKFVVRNSKVCCAVPFRVLRFRFALAKFTSFQFKFMLALRVIPGILVSSNKGLMSFLGVKETPPRFAFEKRVLSITT